MKPVDDLRDGIPSSIPRESQRTLPARHSDPRVAVTVNLVCRTRPGSGSRSSRPDRRTGPALTG